MKEKMIHLIKSAMTDTTKFHQIEEIYTLYDRLQYSENLEDMAEVLVLWLFDKYQIEDIHFSLFDLTSELSSIILKKGKDFYLDDASSVYFIINTHTELNAVISFFISNTEQQKIILRDKDFIDATFFQISPIIQNGIMKKHHIESSSIDSVTNVFNRQYLIKRIRKIINLSNYKERNISFLMIGIDRFKAVIEEFDYDVADKLLIELAKVIHKVVNEFDIVARLAGDEFLVALVNVKSSLEAHNIALQIVNEFAKTEIMVNELTKQILKKTVCVGISSFPKDGDSITKVVKNADNFLNEAKNKGRSQIAIYSKEDESPIDLF